HSALVPPSSSCPQPLSMCKANPCDVTKCISFPMATCIPNYCGGCTANFYFNGIPLDNETCSNIII
ncbi:neurogenic locus notch protein 1, partial [Biomphalaria glabrata]